MLNLINVIKINVKFLFYVKFQAKPTFYVYKKHEGIEKCIVLLISEGNTHIA